MSTADLVLQDARVVTLCRRAPRAEAVAVTAGRIAWVGSNDGARRLRGRGTRVLDCGGQCLVPGFVDAHCHLLAYASSLLAADCRPPGVRSIAELARVLRAAAARAAPDAWVRGAGYDPWSLREGRHPTRWDLDAAVPDRPVRVSHRSGHAWVLNSLALKHVGISIATADPPGGFIDRDPTTGEPSGLLLDMDGYLDPRVPSLAWEEMAQAVAQASRRLVSRGVTSAQDATHHNSVARWDLLRRLKDAGLLAPRVTVMVGRDHLEGFAERGLVPGSGDADLNVGPMKVMPPAASRRLRGPRLGLVEAVRAAQGRGFQAAMHAVEAAAVREALAAMASAEASREGCPSRAAPRHRIEHCSECPPRLVDAVRRSGVVVVTHPAFVYASGDRYLAEVPPRVRPWLYRVGSLLAAGVVVAAGSDAPVEEPDPLVGMYAAVTRRTRSSRILGRREAVSAEEALVMHTWAAAYAARQEAEKGSIEVGKLADLALLSVDPLAGDPERLLDARVVLTVIGGKVVWEG